MYDNVRDVPSVWANCFLHNRLLSNGLCIGDEGDFLSCQDERDFEGWKRLESIPSLVSCFAFGGF